MFALLSLCVAKRDYRTTGGVTRGPNLVYFSDRNNCWARQILQLINEYWLLSNNVTISGQYSLLIFIIVVFCMQNSRPECFHALPCHTIFCHRMWYIDLIYWHIISFHLTSYYYAIFCNIILCHPAKSCNILLNCNCWANSTHGYAPLMHYHTQVLIQKCPDFFVSKIDTILMSCTLHTW